MRTYGECLSCMLKQALATARRWGADARVEERAMRAVLEMLSRADYALPPPRLACDIYPAIYRALGTPDPYAAIKRECNARALALYPRLREQVQRAADPFAVALRIALAGNIIDFASGGAFDLEATIARMLEADLAVDHSEELRRQLSTARRILYLADNAGEVVLDRLLIEQLSTASEVVLALRGGPIINDATLEDAAAAGFADGRVQLIEPGVTLPGIWLERSTPAFRRYFAEADVVIAKGQGNFETLHQHEPRPIFFLFMVKCAMVAAEVDRPLGDALVLLRGATA